MPDTHTVPVILDVTPEAAAALEDPATRAVRPAGSGTCSRRWTPSRPRRAAAASPTRSSRRSSPPTTPSAGTGRPPRDRA